MSSETYDASRGADRREQRTPLYFPERRAGFERRNRAGWRGTYQESLRTYRDNPSTFMLVLATIVVFNYIDYQLTVRILGAGGVELNPLMARLFALSPIAAVTAKLGAVGVSMLILLSLRQYRRTLEASLLLLVAYTALMFYHAGLAIQPLS
ncbi:MAG: hypothetical protein GY926_27070 [bacterium]|nr:hypothetical protein [bacterium]MCP4968877.1 hypothetical protein [bacterium]